MLVASRDSQYGTGAVGWLRQWHGRHPPQGSPEAPSSAWSSTGRPAPGHGPLGIVHPQWRTSVAGHPGTSRASLRGGRRDIDCSIHDAEGKALKSLPEQIMEHAEAMPEATPICPAALLHLGQRAAVGQALSRLARSGRLMRIRQGVYMRPIESRFGRCAPGIEKSPQALSELWGETIVPNVIRPLSP